MKPSPLLCASLAVGAALAAWLIHSTAPRIDAVPTTAIAAAPVPKPPRAAATVATGTAEPASREARAAAFPLPSAFAPSASPVAVSSPADHDAPSSPAAVATSSQVDPSAAEADFLPPLSTTDGSPPVPGRAVDSAAPGNFIRFRGIRAAVAGSYESGKPADRALALDILPEAQNESADPAADDFAPVATAADSEANRPTATAKTDSGDVQKAGNPNSPGAPPPVPVPASGRLTREDELFRAKWGWAAYDAAQREARKEAGK